jgi:Zn-dependent protease with chaperone function
LQKEAGPDDEHGLQYLASHPPIIERIRRFENWRPTGEKRRSTKQEK